MWQEAWLLAHALVMEPSAKRRTACVTLGLKRCVGVAGGRLLAHVPVTEPSAKRKEPQSAKRASARPGTVVNGTVLHVSADHATIQLDSGEHPDPVQTC